MLRRGSEHAGSVPAVRVARAATVGWAAALTLLLLAGALLAGCDGADLEQVQLDSGPVVGFQLEVDDHEVWVFKGVPYAAPPVGEFRWKPPQPVAAWDEPRVCAEFGGSCPQLGAGEGMFNLAALAVGPINEDCLYLNVWSPADSADEQLPVMVWIHGGSFESGSGSMAIYDGANLATKGVVVVTINYRLGPLGFLAHPALSAESADGVSGNYGLLDQVAALHWVRNNIAGFGGDPSNVTVFGESAGAISILDLLVSPVAEGLFDRAIAQSGILLDHGFGVSTAGTLEAAEAAGEAYAAYLELDPSGDVLAQMRAKTADELVQAASAYAKGLGLLEQGLTWTPVADGRLLSDLPGKLWAEGGCHDVPLLIGSNADEGNLFVAGLTVSSDAYEAQMQKIFGPYAQEALALYPNDGTQGLDSGISRMLTEVGFASTARLAARSMDEWSDSPAYLYQFTRVPLVMSALGAFHSIEIPYVMGNADLFSSLGTLTKTDLELSEAIMGYWTRFAATGDPNGD
ncbi:MAG: carboxylesterase family protein, partial [Thermoleophilia bacterium]|nr:carboxylesterase family protein [Thermoleophilia bacterium]